MERENGIVLGVVTDLNDPENLGRVRVRLPHLNDQQSDWSRVATPMGGKDPSTPRRNRPAQWSPPARY